MRFSKGNLSTVHRPPLPPVPVISYEALATVSLKGFFNLQPPLQLGCPSSGLHDFFEELLQQSPNQFPNLELQPPFHPTIYSPTTSRMILLKHRSDLSLIRNLQSFSGPTDTRQTTERFPIKAPLSLSALLPVVYPGH